ncbi:uncharacterized protein LOC109856979 isoform X1 [Pseudomyrmex gracilis]|uniref:uncharacterized protein LOC109856979 isoform X1 n=1 Tax=Pseudomyrmex gracilis TaxID=219809 RepID=UPI000994CDF5|nr:uncharacterized protein LOC109856979 isoform X1 [Pseudomyrmex gracilis]
MCKENVFLKNVLVILSQCSSRYLFRPLEERELGFRVTSSNRAEAQTRIVTLTLFFFVCRSRDLRWDQRRRLSELLAAERGCTFAATEMSAVWTNVQDEAQSEDPHEIRMRGSEEFSLSHMPFQLHAEHQSAPSSYAAARHLSAAEVLEHPEGEANTSRRTKYNLLENNSSTSTGFTCHQCNRSYQLKHNLMRHLRFECGEHKHFACSLCPQRYRQNVKLRQHMINVHNIFVPPQTSRRSFICQASSLNLNNDK